MPKAEKYPVEFKEYPNGDWDMHFSKGIPAGVLLEKLKKAESKHPKKS